MKRLLTATCVLLASLQGGFAQDELSSTILWEIEGPDELATPATHLLNLDSRILIGTGAKRILEYTLSGVPVGTLVDAGGPDIGGFRDIEIVGGNLLVQAQEPGYGLSVAEYDSQGNQAFYADVTVGQSGTGSILDVEGDLVMAWASNCCGTGQTWDTELKRFDGHSGNVLWNTDLCYSCNASLGCCSQGKDYPQQVILHDGHLFVFKWNVTAPYVRQIGLQKVTLDGDIVLDIILDDHREFTKAISHASGILISGYVGDTPNKSPFISKVNANGEEIWSVTAPAVTNATPIDLIPLDNGHFLFAYFEGSTVHLLEISAGGDILNVSDMAVAQPILELEFANEMGAHLLQLSETEFMLAYNHGVWYDDTRFSLVRFAREGTATESTDTQVPDYVPTDGLVGWFPLDGNIVNEVNGAVGNTISTTAEPDRNGQASASLGFNGSAYGVLNNAGMPTGEFSVSAWVKQNQSWSTGNGIEFICVGSASNTAWGTIAGPEFIHLNRGRGCSGNGQVLSGVNFPLNEWVHLTYVCAGIGANADIYLNGEYAGQSLNLTSGSCGASNLYFGVDIFSAPEYITGGLDDVGIWNRQLSAEEVQQVFASEPPFELPTSVPTEGLVAFYPFNGNANDESGNGHDGTMDGALFGQDREGSASASATFDGVDDGVFIPHHPDFESAEKTISFWMNPTSNQLLDTPGLNDGMGILNKTDHTASNTINRYYAVTLGQGTNGTAPFSLTLATSTGNIVTTGSSVESTTAQDAINISEWQHVSAVQSATELKLYLNGIQISSSPLLNAPIENDYDIKIGVDYKFNDYRYFNGSIDEISFHNRALSEDEIAAMAGVTTTAATPSYVPTDGLVAWYPFNGNAEDESGNGFDGTVDGAVLGMDRFSNPNRAYVFDGDDRIFPANPEGFPTQDRTTSVWMKSLNAATGGRVLMGYGGSSCGNSWILTYNNQGHLPSTQNAFEIQGHCNNNSVAAPLPPEELTDWHLVVVRTSAQGTDILIDGVLAQHASLFIDDTAPGCAVFGAMPSTGGGCYYEDANNALWDGWLDDIGIWNRALSDEEVLALYNAAPPILGCTDPDACNLDPTANSDDGSCEYGCQYCGPGTVWDPVLQFCVAEVPEATAAEDCSLFTLQELSTGYLYQQQQMDALDTLVVTQQAAIDSLNVLLNNCTGND